MSAALALRGLSVVAHGSSDRDRPYGGGRSGGRGGRGGRGGGGGGGGNQRYDDRAQRYEYDDSGGGDRRQAREERPYVNDDPYGARTQPRYGGGRGSGRTAGGGGGGVQYNDGGGTGATLEDRINIRHSTRASTEYDDYNAPFAAEEDMGRVALTPGGCHHQLVSATVRPTSVVTPGASDWLRGLTYFTGCHRLDVFLF
jgi:hypothetical protein